MSSETKNDQPQQPAGNANVADECMDAEGECPEIRLAAEAVRFAKMEFEKAQKYYDDLRMQASAKIKLVCETTIGDVLDNTLETVKKHPGASMIVTAALGFCLGRWFQKLFKRL